MSHLSHKDIAQQWQQYEQAKLNDLRRRKKRFERFEILTFLYALSLACGSFIAEKPEHKTLLLVNSALIVGTTMYTDTKKEERVQQEKKRLQWEKQRFFNQFKP